ncbi:SufS family cysteine desulfurase [Raineya sp.]|jgi:cysteine desulfurase/selenocysteine lyase
MKSASSLDIQAIREQFPILGQSVHGKKLVYLDNAATSQKPISVINALSEYYTSYNANIHRGAHYLAAKATEIYEQAREKVAKFLNARSSEEIIFTRGTTEGINLVASTFGRKFIGEGDEIIISTMEHHSNIVPWQMLCEEKKAVLKVIPINENGEILLNEYEKLLSPRTKLVSVVHISNALGTINPIREMIQKAHSVGAKFLVDGAQGAVHLSIDVQDLDCDFYAFSGHKVYAPTGTGALYGKKEILEQIPPYHGGGEMIKEVTFEKTTYNELPFKFEAGTPNIADVIALGKALDFVNELGKENIATHEQELLTYATEKIQKIEGIKIIGTALHKASVLSFVVAGVHHSDIGTILDTQGVAVRTGHHCTQPLMKRLGLEGTTRASFAVYNTFDEVDTFISALERAVKMLK